MRNKDITKINFLFPIKNKKWALCNTFAKHSKHILNGTFESGFTRIYSVCFMVNVNLSFNLSLWNPKHYQLIHIDVGDFFFNLKKILILKNHFFNTLLIGTVPQKYTLDGLLSVLAGCQTPSWNNIKLCQCDCLRLWALLKLDIIWESVIKMEANWMPII